jgi:hypothetical protein
MSILSFVEDNIKATPADLLKPLKEKIESQLKQRVEHFNLEIDNDSKTFIIRANGHEHREKNVLTVYAFRSVIKMKLGTKAPDFNNVVVHYDKGIVGVAIRTKEGIQTFKL